MTRIFSATLSVLKYLIALYFIYAGVETAFMPIHEHDNPAGFIYSSRVALTLLGIWFMSSGFALFISKLFKYDEGIGTALLSMYLAFLFASILNGFYHDWTPDSWAPNLIASFIIGALYLRWKYSILYFPPRPRRQIVEEFMNGQT